MTVGIRRMPQCEERRTAQSTTGLPAEANIATARGLLKTAKGERQNSKPHTMTSPPFGLSVAPT